MYQAIPYTAADFIWTQWTAEDVERAGAGALEKLQKDVDVIVNFAGVRTFENTVYALEMASAAFSGVHSKIDFLQNVSPDQRIRDTAQQVADNMSTVYVDVVSYNEQLYAAFKVYAGQVSEPLDAPSKRLFDDSMRAYRRLGFDLAEHDRAVLKENAKKMQLLCSEFQKNVNDYQAHIVVQPEETGGLSEQYLKGLQLDEQGNYVVDITYPQYLPFMENAQNAAKRKELFDLYYKKGGVRNLDILQELVGLRAQNAKLLGYKTHADYVTEVKMAKSASTVDGFLDGLKTALRKAADEDFALLENAKRNALSDPSATIAYYDTAYFANELQKSTYDLDKEVVRQYFPLEHVLKQMMDIYSAIFGVHFERVLDFPVWFPGVEIYEVRNTDGSLVSYFGLDLHPREGKYSHAAEFPVVVGHKAHMSSAENGYIAPFACMVANFPPSVESAPSLMPHDQVETLFHEFGHVMHENFGNSQFYSQSGTNVARDFVEAPSQMLENWTWDRNVLKRISKHYVTGESLPDGLIDRMLAAKNFMGPYANMRQVVLGTYDFNIHTKDIVDVLGEYNALVAELLHITLLPEHIWPASFGHLAGGYDAGYYGYLWSKVYACDMFTRFKHGGLLNSEIGREYRKKVLEVGSRRDELESVEDFLGRPVSQQAFLEDLGIVQ